MTFRYHCLNKRCTNPDEKKEFDFLHIPRDSKAVCPYCASCVSERVFAPATSFELKGSGWYKDGYHTKKKR